MLTLRYVVMQCLHCTREIFTNRQAALKLGWTEIILDGQIYWRCPLHSSAEAK
jgi:hypothetical protein